jgi:hypothetical protein
MSGVPCRDAHGRPRPAQGACPRGQPGREACGQRLKWGTRGWRGRNMSPNRGPEDRGQGTAGRLVAAAGECGVAGCCWSCLPCRRRCRCGCWVRTPRMRTRPRTCGRGIWSGRTGCTARRFRRSRRISRGRRCSIRRWGRWLTAWEGWPGRECCRWCSCSGRRRCCGMPRACCSGAGRRFSRPRCSPCSGRRCIWGRSRPTTLSG